MDKVKLHRCSWTFLHVDMDACWKVQRHLDEAGIPYEVVKHGYGKGTRPEVEELSRPEQAAGDRVPGRHRLPRRSPPTWPRASRPADLFQSQTQAA